MAELSKEERDKIVKALEAREERTRKMKRTLSLIICLAACALTANAQQPTDAPKEVKTKLEAFQAKTGVVIIRGFSEIGKLRGMYSTAITVEIKEFTDASSGRKEYGMTIQVKGGGRLERENTSYIDYDEIESLIKGIDYIAKIDNSVTQLNNFQADYRTKDDLVFSTFSSNGEVLFAVSSGRIGEATAYFKLSNLADVRNLIVNAKAKLDSVRQGVK